MSLSTVAAITASVVADRAIDSTTFVVIARIMLKALLVNLLTSIVVITWFLIN